MKPIVRKEVKELLISSITEKVRNYEPETKSKPFFEAIFSKGVVKLASLIQSFYTTFGMSIYEQIAVLLATKNAGYIAKRQYSLIGRIDSETETLINNIHLEILKSRVAGSKGNQIQQIRNSIKTGHAIQDPDSCVDLFIKIPSGQEFFFDLTTAKPNIKEFRTLKKKLLRWVALRLSTDKSIKVNTALAIPYNPYEPKPYNRWTAANLFDKGELLVGPDFWNFVAGEDVYYDLLKVFKEVGKEIHPIINGAMNNSQKS